MTQKNKEKLDFTNFGVTNTKNKLKFYYRKLSLALRSKIFWTHALPYLLSFGLIAIVLISGIFLVESRKSNTTTPAVNNNVQAPVVLGASTSIRGKNPAATSNPAIFKKIKEPDFSNISAKSFLIYDFDSGQVLADKSPDMRLPIASLTKLITGLVAYDNLDFSAQTEITAADVFDVSPAIHLKVGDKVKINDLFDSMIVGSANDAALALANHTEQATGEDFISLMNQKAQDLGMTNTKFSNVLGFDYKNNYSTASDLRLAIVATQKLAVFNNLSRQISITFQGALGQTYYIAATDKLLKNHPEIEAIKTGYTESSLGSIIVKVTSSGRKLIFIVLGSLNREQDLLNLEQEILQSFKAVQN